MLESAEIGRESEHMLHPVEMTYADFAREYDAVMSAVAEKEKIGGLDFDDPKTYREMTQREHALMATDWKQFSRERGFSEEDIIEYERWLTLSGQADNLPDAINDPWRRRADYPGEWKRKLYVDHVEESLKQGAELDPEVVHSYEAEKAELERVRSSYLDSPTLASGVASTTGISASHQERFGAMNPDDDFL